MVLVDDDVVVVVGAAILLRLFVDGFLSMSNFTMDTEVTVEAVLFLLLFVTVDDVVVDIDGKPCIVFLLTFSFNEG